MSDNTERHPISPEREKAIQTYFYNELWIVSQSFSIFWKRKGSDEESETVHEIKRDPNDLAELQEKQKQLYDSMSDDERAYLEWLQTVVPNPLKYNRPIN